MHLRIQQAPRTRDGDVIRGIFIQTDPQELAQVQRIGQPPGNATLAVDALEDPFMVWKSRRQR